MAFFRFGMVIAGGCMASAVFAQPREMLIPALEVCRAELNAAARLDCYDKALDGALGVDETIAAKREMVKREQFGLPTDSNGMRMTELETSIREVDYDQRRDLTLVALENGQVWQLLSQGGLRAGFVPGAKVVISAGNLGSFRLRIQDKVGFRSVKRVR